MGLHGSERKVLSPEMEYEIFDFIKARNISGFFFSKTELYFILWTSARNIILICMGIKFTIR